MNCGWCGTKLDHPTHPKAAKYINPETLQPSPSGQRFVFCSYDHKEKWLNSPMDNCWLCGKRLKTDSPLNECITIHGVEFYLCPIHKAPIWREEFNQKTKEAIEEWIELDIIDVQPSSQEAKK